MNTAAAGRQMQRSGHNHQRHNSSEKFLFEQTLPSSGLSVTQQVDYSKMLRIAQRGVSGEFLRSLEPLAPPLSSRPSGQRENRADVSLIEMSPGILDLHSYDTELLSDIRASGFYDDLEPRYSGKNQMGKDWLMTEDDISKSFAVDKEKQNSVAKIKVVVRKRPLNKKERAKKEEDIVTIEKSTSSLTVHETKLKVDLKEYIEKHEFVFDAVLDEDVLNNELYCQTVEPLIPAIFQRTKATCIAYGQTGSGKTYTMQPLPLRASEHILSLMNHAYRNQGFQLFVSFFEIYGGKVYDLLSDRRKLCMREDGKQQVCIVGLQEFLVSSVEAIRELINKGNGLRSTGTTGANEESSRSHSILQLAIKKLPVGIETKSPRAISKLSFIDLAGSERGADTTDNDKQTRIEGAEINRSLLALKECIRALDSDQNHIPFRGSKLTEVLRDSFMGNSRTVMISCISPSSGSCEHTLNTLRYADRLKSLSKVSNPKKELSSSSNPKESTAAGLSSSLPNLSEPENGNAEFTTGTHRGGWAKQIQKAAPSNFNAHNVPTGKKVAYEQDNMSWRRTESYSAPLFDEKKQRSSAQVRQMGDSIDVDNNLLNSDDFFINILKEEEDLVIAHRRHVEEMMDIVREDMKLLGERERPGRQLDSSYTSRLDAILSQKAAGIGHLQERLENFQKILMKHKVLVPSYTQ